jgi:hypothetical protein
MTRKQQERLAIILFGASIAVSVGFILAMALSLW